MKRIIFLLLIASKSFGQFITEPAFSQCSLAKLTNRTSTTLTFSWTDGGGSSRICLMKSGSAVNANPANGSTYTANTTFGSGSQIGTGNYVVALGSGPVTVTGLTAETVYYISVFELTGSGGSTVYNTLSPANAYGYYTDLVAQYSFENTGADGMGNNFHKCNVIKSTYVAGKVGSNAVNFAGSVNSYAWIQDASTFSFNNNVPPTSTDKPFSISVWVKPTNFTNIHYILDKRLGVTGVEEYAFSIATSGAINFAMFSQGSGSIFLLGTSVTTLSSGVWSHVVVTYDGTKVIGGLKIYINNVSSTITNSSAGSYQGMLSKESNVTIGKYAFEVASGTSGFVGPMDELLFYKKALSSGEVSTLYNSGNGFSPSFPVIDFTNFSYYEIDPYVFAERGNWVFAGDNFKLYWSTDGGYTFQEKNWGKGQTNLNSQQEIPGLWPDFSYIFDDGTLLFGCANKLFRSTDGLQHISPVVFYQSNGSVYTPHTPVNANKPGSYFSNGSNTWSNFAYVNGVETLVWTNYGNVAGYKLGAAPINIWYSVDKGATVKSLFLNGQNSIHYDDGTDEGGSSGTTLGDPLNTTEVPRHGHQVVWRPGTNEFYSQTGDYNGAADAPLSGSIGEISWRKHVYDYVHDTWTNTTLLNHELKEARWFSVGFNFHNDSIYFSTDIPLSASASERGIWRISPGDIATKANSVRQQDIGNQITYAMMMVGNKVVVGGQSNTGLLLDANVAIVTNYGKGAVTYIPLSYTAYGSDLKGRMWPPNSKGFVKVCIGGSRELPISTLYIKP